MGGVISNGREATKFGVSLTLTLSIMDSDMNLELLLSGLDFEDQEHALNTIKYSEIVVESEQIGISMKSKN